MSKAILWETGVEMYGEVPPSHVATQRWKGEFAVLTVELVEIIR